MSTVRQAARSRVESRPSQVWILEMRRFTPKKPGGCQLGPKSMKQWVVVEVATEAGEGEEEKEKSSVSYL